MNPDTDLLRAYVKQRSEAAFADIVARHLDLVYSAALRQVGGNAHLAQDAAQLTFADLARKSSSLTRHANLAGWLYTSACYAALKLVRAEARRAAREKDALLMDEITACAAAPADWERVRPLLDSAMLQLNAVDREAVILRFFTGRSFAEIGAAQSLSENAARKRVTRALDKLHGLLARHGFSSTSVALATVLSQQSVSAAPVGLAQSVSGLALASAATGASSTLGGTFLTFMSASKLLSLGGLAAVLLLGLSLFSTAFLVVERATENQPAIPFASLSTATRPGTAVGADAPLTMAEVSRSLVTDANLASLRDELRAAGASDARVREVLFGILRRRYRADLSAKRIARIERAWWLDDQRINGISRNSPALRDEPGMNSESVDVPLAKLLGPDPGRVALLDVRYNFLPSDLRLRFFQFDRDTELQWEPTGDSAVDARIDADLAQRAKNAVAERARLLASLPQEQRDEYELRFGSLGMRLASQLLVVPGGTEEEFRQVYRLTKDYTSRQLPEGPATFGAPDSAMIDRFVAALGFDRSLDYLWTGSSEYRTVATLASQGVLPTTTAAQFTQLAAETGNKALAIHQDTSLTPEQRQAALRDLQAAVRPQVDALLPPEVQQKLGSPALGWFQQLAEGKYKVLAPAIPGANGGFGILLFNGLSPAPRSLTVSLPHRPANR